MFIKNKKIKGTSLSDWTNERTQGLTSRAILHEEHCRVAGVCTSALCVASIGSRVQSPGTTTELLTRKWLLLAHGVHLRCAVILHRYCHPGYSHPGGQPAKTTERQQTPLRVSEAPARSKHSPAFTKQARTAKHKTGLLGIAKSTNPKKVLILLNKIFVLK